MATHELECTVLATATASFEPSVRMNSMSLSIAATASSTPTPSEQNFLDVGPLKATATVTPTPLSGFQPTVPPLGATALLTISYTLGVGITVIIGADASVTVESPIGLTPTDLELLAAASVGVTFILADPFALNLLAFASLDPEDSQQGHALDLILEATASLQAEFIPCRHIPMVNDEGDPLIISVGRCPSCRPQPFFPRLFADSERRSVPVPVINNVIEYIVLERGTLATLVNLHQEPLVIVTTGLVLSKHDAPQYGHYLGWTLKGEDPPFRVETVEMEFAATRTWDAP